MSENLSSKRHQATRWFRISPTTATTTTTRTSKATNRRACPSKPQPGLQWALLVTLAGHLWLASGHQQQTGSVPFKTSFVSASDYSIRRNGALGLSSMANSPHESHQPDGLVMLMGAQVDSEQPSHHEDGGQSSLIVDSNQFDVVESAAASSFSGLTRSSGRPASGSHGDQQQAANYFNSGDHLVASSAEQHGQQPRQHDDPLLAASSQVVNDNSTAATTTSTGRPANEAASSPPPTTTTTTTTTPAPSAHRSQPVTTTASSSLPPEAAVSTTTTSNLQKSNSSTSPTMTTTTTTSSPPTTTTTAPPPPTTTANTTTISAQSVRPNNSTAGPVVAATTSTTTTTTTTTTSTTSKPGQLARESRRSSNAEEPGTEQQPLGSSTKVPRFGYLSPRDQSDEPNLPVFTSTRSSPQQQANKPTTTTMTSNQQDSSRSQAVVISRPCGQQEDGSKCGTFVVSSVPVLVPSNSSSNSSELVNEFVFVPEDSGPLSFDESSFSTTGKPSEGQNKRTNSTESLDSADNLKAEHRTIDGDGDASGDVELDYVTSNEDDKQRAPQVSPKVPALEPTAAPTTTRPSTTTSTSTTRQPMITTRAATTTTTTTTTTTSTTPRPKAADVGLGARISQSSSYSVRVSSSSSSSSAADSNQRKVVITTKRPNATAQPELANTRNKSTGRENQKLMRESTTQAELSKLTANLKVAGSPSTSTTKAPTLVETQPAASAGRQRRPKSNSYRRFYSEPTEADWQRRQQHQRTTSVGVFSPVNNGADEEEANILTRYSIGSQLARLSSRSLNANNSTGSVTSRQPAWLSADTSPIRGTQRQQQQLVGASEQTSTRNRLQPARVPTSTSTAQSAPTTTTSPTSSPVDGSNLLTVSSRTGEEKDRGQEEANTSQLLQQALNGQLMTLISSSLPGPLEQPVQMSSVAATATSAAEQPKERTATSTSTSTEPTAISSTSSVPTTTTSSSATTTLSSGGGSSRGSQQRGSVDFGSTLEDQLAHDALHGQTGLELTNLARPNRPRHQTNTYSASSSSATHQQVDVRQASRRQPSSGAATSTTRRPNKWQNDGMWQPDTNETAGGANEAQSALNSSNTSSSSNNNNLLPGRPGVDYPVHWQPPKTSFDCLNYELSGFYADVESDCQAYHSCHRGRGGRHTFLCPNGTLFSQELLTCDWWYNVECSGSKLYLQQANNRGAQFESSTLREANAN